MPEWTPEHVVDARRAAALIGRQFPRLRGAAVTELATGWDNTVHRVDAADARTDGPWVFRFPRRAVALPLLEREIAVLPRLAPRLPLPVPVPELVGVPADGYPWPFWGARLLPGRELPEAALPDADRAQAAAAVGAFLKALHADDVSAACGAGLPVDPTRRATPAVRVPQARERLDRLLRSSVWEADPAVYRLLARAEPLGDPTGTPVVVHGDLNIRHLLVDDAGAAAGVIDWGDLCRADPAVDLSLAYAAFAGAARAALLAAYGPVDEEREMRGRMLAVFLSAALADYAAAEQRQALLAEALAGLRRAVR